MNRAKVSEYTRLTVCYPSYGYYYCGSEALASPGSCEAKASLPKLK